MEAKRGGGGRAAVARQQTSRRWQRENSSDAPWNRRCVLWTPKAAFIPAQSNARGNDPTQPPQRQRRGFIPAWANGPGHDRKRAKGLKARPIRWHPRRWVGRWRAGDGWNGLSALAILARPCPGALPQAGMRPRRWRWAAGVLRRARKRNRCDQAVYGWPSYTKAPKIRANHTARRIPSCAHRAPFTPRSHARA
jgi:hypothetical protein